MNNIIEQGVPAPIQGDSASEPIFTPDVERKQAEVVKAGRRLYHPPEEPLASHPTVEKSERIAMGVASLISAAPGAAGILRAPQAQVQYGEASFQQPMVAPTGETLITSSTRIPFTPEQPANPEQQTTLHLDAIEAADLNPGGTPLFTRNETQGALDSDPQYGQVKDSIHAALAAVSATITKSPDARIRGITNVTAVVAGKITVPTSPDQKPTVTPTPPEQKDGQPEPSPVLITAPGFGFLVPGDGKVYAYDNSKPMAAAGLKNPPENAYVFITPDGRLLFADYKTGDVFAIGQVGTNGLEFKKGEALKSAFDDAAIEAQNQKLLESQPKIANGFHFPSVFGADTFVQYAPKFQVENMAGADALKKEGNFADFIRIALISVGTPGAEPAPYGVGSKEMQNSILIKENQLKGMDWNQELAKWKSVPLGDPSALVWLPTMTNGRDGGIVNYKDQSSLKWVKLDPRGADITIIEDPTLRKGISYNGKGSYYYQTIEQKSDGSSKITIRINRLYPQGRGISDEGGYFSTLATLDELVAMYRDFGSPFTESITIDSHDYQFVFEPIQAAFGIDLNDKQQRIDYFKLFKVVPASS